MKKQSQYIRLALALTVIIFSIGCKRSLEKVNINPNGVSSDVVVTPDQFLPSAQESIFGQYIGFPGQITQQTVQHLAKVLANDGDRYIFPNSSVSNFWLATYAESLPDLALVKRFAGANTNYIAISEIMQCWEYSLLTDFYGDVPYTEAGKGTEGLYQPRYDSQESIYLDLVKRLKEVNGIISLSSNPVKGDIVLNGNMAKWQKFANSLMLRLLVRMSAKKDVKSQLAELLNNPAKYPLIITNADNIQLNYLTVLADENPFYTGLKARNDWRLTKTLVDRMKALNDPRLTVFADPAESGGAYTGLVPGETGASQTLTSKTGLFFSRQVSPAVVITAAEVQFLLAEASFKNLVTGNYKDYYNKAILLSFQQYSGVQTFGGAVFVAPAAGSTYFMQPGVELTGNGDFEKIMTQKWISAFGQPFEPWIEWRRTGFPVLTPSVNNSNANVIPVRMIYPSTEQGLNATSYAEAVTRQGSDDYNTRVWWNK